jgi:hypothetical protein
MEKLGRGFRGRSSPDDGALLGLFALAYPFVGWLGKRENMANWL